MIETDVLIIGAGPSGTVGAAIVHQEGFKVIIVEKEKFPRFVIGESLLPCCMEHLEKAFFIPALEKKKFQLKKGAKFVRGDEICYFNFADQFTDGWNYTWQVPRAVFDTTLAEEIEKRGVPVLYQTTVKEIQLHEDHSITTVEDQDGNLQTIKARYIMDASGYGRVMPRLFGWDKPSVLPPRYTFFCHLQDIHRSLDPDPEFLTYYIFDREFYLWIIPFSNGNTSVGFVGNPDFFEPLEGTTPAEKYRSALKLDPRLEARFGDAPFVFEPNEIYGFSIAVEKLWGNGFVLTGNSTEFLDPIFSSGVTLATESGLRAATLICRQLKCEKVDWKTEYEDHLKSGVDTFKTYVQAWYDGSLQDIFFASPANHQIKQQICSVLSGYVWDLNNPYVQKHKQRIQTLGDYVKMKKSEKGKIH